MPHSTKKIQRPDRELFAEAYRTMSGADVGQMFGISSSLVSRIAKEFGLDMKMPGRRAPRRKSIDQEVVDLDAAEQQLLAKLAEVRQLKEKNKIHFEWMDNSTVVVYGVTVKFRELGGVAAFSEFILTRWKPKVVPQK
jgi:transposase